VSKSRPPRGHLGFPGRSIGRFLGRLTLLTLVVALGWVILRIAAYRQEDDAAHSASKELYLESIAAAGPASTAPNFVVIVFDDLGAGDLGSYGSRSVATPNLDRLAAEGARFTQAYASSPYCSASRAGLLTGRYAPRSGLDHVLQPAGTWANWALRVGKKNLRMPREEILLPEILSAAGYATAMVGKWHLGESSPSLPNDRGFDSFFGMLHSNDQGNPVLRRDGAIVEPSPIDQETLTRRYTEEAVGFLERQTPGGRPFFLYMPHTFPHIPLHVAGDRLGRSQGGLYGDVIEELDWSVGRVVETLDRLGLADETLVLVTSDNGPWFQGSPGGTRGRKMDIFEGGLRVPLIARRPGNVVAGLVRDEPVVGIDLVPTALELTGLAAPNDRLLDGRSLVPLLTVDGAATGAGNPDRPVWFHQIGRLVAVRVGRFKYHDRHPVVFGNPMNWRWAPWRPQGPWLFDLELDPAESYDATARHPDVAAEMAEMFAKRKAEMAANPRGWVE
jgi:arylsulfatase A-like enzyme